MLVCRRTRRYGLAAKDRRFGLLETSAKDPGARVPLRPRSGVAGKEHAFVD